MNSCTSSTLSMLSGVVPSATAWQVLPAVHHARGGRGVAQGVDERHLPRLGGVHRQGRVAVDDARARLRPVGVERLGVEDGVLALAQKGAHRHAAEDDGRRGLALTQVEVVLVDAQRQVGDAAPLEDGEQRLEPLGMFVDDGESGLGTHGILATPTAGRRRAGW
jgi:hypothetical protein